MYFQDLLVCCFLSFAWSCTVAPPSAMLSLPAPPFLLCTALWDSHVHQNQIQKLSNFSMNADFVIFFFPEKT